MRRDGQHERAHTHLNEARRIAGMWSDGPWHAGVMEAQALLRHVEGASTDEVRDLLARAAEGYRAAGRHAAAERCQTLI